MGVLFCRKPINMYISTVNLIYFEMNFWMRIHTWHVFNDGDAPLNVVSPEVSNGKSSKSLVKNLDTCDGLHECVSYKNPNDSFEAQNGQEMVETRGWWWENGDVYAGDVC